MQSCNSNGLMVCRLCLAELEENVESSPAAATTYIFGATSDNDNGLVTLVQDLTGIEVKEEDDMPSMICKPCACMLGIIENFKNACLRTDRALRERRLLVATEVKEEEVVKDEEVVNEEEEVQEPALRKSSRNLKTPEVAEKLLKTTILCDICGKSVSKRKIDSHIASHDQQITTDEPKTRTYPCTEVDCAKTFPTEFQCKSHVYHCHMKEYKYTCEVCGKQFKVNTSYIIHKSYHFEPQLPCEVCGKKLRHKRALKTHMMSHSGERPFACQICFKSFHTKYNLRTHERTHTNTRPFQCTICGKSFVHKNTYQYHMKNVHRVVERLKITQLPIVDDDLAANDADLDVMEDLYALLMGEEEDGDDIRLVSINQDDSLLQQVCNEVI